MKKCANFTLHDQTFYLDVWRGMGYEMSVEKYAPLINFPETPEKVISEGYEAVLIGGLSNVMAYAWYAFSQAGIEVIMAKTPRKRTPDGRFIFELRGVQKVFSVDEVKGRLIK